MKKLRETGPGRYVAAITRSIHPVRAIYEVCCTALFTIPFLAAFAMTRSAPLSLYLVYPLLFLAAHVVWFRLPSIHPRLRWLLLWLTLTIVVALGTGFIFWSYREAAARGAGFAPESVLSIPHWITPTFDAAFPLVAVFFLVPSGIGAALYCLVFSLFLRIYRAYRAEERQGRIGGKGPGERGSLP